MKVEVINGEVRYDGKKYAVGETLEADDKEANRLIKLGFAKKAGGEGGGTPAANKANKGGDK